MALYIRDPEVDRLVAEVQRLTRTATKTEAVKNALKKQIEAANADVPLSERLDKVIEMARQLGPRDPDFDMKKFSDELYDHLETSELLVVPGARHIDFYDRTDLIPFDRLEQFFTDNLA